MEGRGDLNRLHAVVDDLDLVPVLAQEHAKGIGPVEVVVRDEDAVSMWRLGGGGRRRGNTADLLPRPERRGQVNYELRALTSPRAVHLHRASVKPHEMLHEGETDPQSARGAIERGVDLHESVEDLREVLGRDANPVIPDADDGLSIAPRLVHAQPDVAVRRGKLRGIAQQVAEDLLETKGIRFQDHGFGGKG